MRGSSSDPHQASNMVKREISQDALECTAAKKTRFITLGASASDDSARIPTQESRLLSLPAELRNKIYGYVLTAESGKFELTVNRSDRRYGYPPKTETSLRLFRVPKGLTKLNRLQFVCRQIYHETAFLELKHNTLKFIQTARDELEPHWQLLEFKDICSPAKFVWVKRIELHIKALAVPYTAQFTYFLTKDHLDAYEVVAKFCRHNPEVKVKYVFNSFSWHPCYHFGPESQAFINQGIRLLKALRDVDVSYLNPDRAAAQELLREGTLLRLGRSIDRWDAPNLTFHPNQSDLDEESFRRHAGKAHESVKGGLEKWIEVTKAWVKDGF